MPPKLTTSVATAALLWALLGSLRPAAATQVELELLRPDGKSFAVHRVDNPVGDEEIVVPDGSRAWSLRLSRSEYDGRLEICIDLARWAVDGEQEPITHSCVAIKGRETPQATTLTKTDPVQLRLTLRRVALP